MLTRTTGPALATGHFAHSVQELRDACVPPRRAGWAALGPAAAVDAMRLAIVALLDALLRLIQEVAAARVAPSPMTAVCPGCDALGGKAADGAVLPCDPVFAIATPNTPRARRSPPPRLAHLPAPAIGEPSGAPSVHRSTAFRSPRALRPPVPVGHFGGWGGHPLPIAWSPSFFRLRPLPQ